MHRDKKRVTAIETQSAVFFARDISGSEAKSGVSGRQRRTYRLLLSWAVMAATALSGCAGMAEKHAQPLELVTRDESGLHDYTRPPGVSTLGAQCAPDKGPIVTVIQPAMSARVHRHTPIEVQWSSRDEAKIDMASIRLLYRESKEMWADKTEKVREWVQSSSNAHLDESGLYVSEASFPIPFMQYQFKLVVYDTSGVCTEKLLTFDVGF